ncbi:hypothetical protein [Acaryochloris sp. IP29b_bin.148]|uniref:class I SAM-dependent methyltransferase n=1 Tax=Acaryochloris sp. IP29b_bin.148 TaxID=2969218 RepID=UPI00260E2C33|nr:hypothetical protein [Acaryochloris sp. IP29b_bin.148]
MQKLQGKIARTVQSLNNKQVRQITPSNNDYWEKRKTLDYYKKVIKLAKKHSPEAQSVIDVGTHISQTITRLDWIPDKTAIDLKHLPEIPGARNIQCDFMTFKPEQRYDLVLCLQVLEHLDCPELFTDKLLKIGKKVIISVPYKWPEGQCQYHVQDPVDEDKLLSWTHKSWIEMAIAHDRAKRMVAVFDGSLS